ncbi:MAG: hypothetical protein HPY66_2717 [Firmicutes bacterium]|nr:hypothetical protein [Bacillota bacterium]MDI6705280.1 alpha/beta hydrolase [Bacillota bacterium]
MHTCLTVVKIPTGRGKVSKFYCQQSQENSLVAIFPDENYNSDRPLLYYAKKAALIEGYDVLCISYRRKLTWRDMGLYTIDIEADSGTDIVRKCLKKTYKRIFFVSKGIGTEVAGIVSNRLGYEKIRNIFLSPTYHTIKHIANSRCIVVVGTNDSIFTQNCISKIQEHRNVEFISIKDANRHLEVPDNINKTMEVLGQVTGTYARFFKELV